MAVLSHYTTIVENIFGGDSNWMVFGLCISNCGGIRSNTNGSQAPTIMTDLAQTYPCNGGTFFWVTEHDTAGSRSSSIGITINSLASAGYSSTPTTLHHNISLTPRPIPAHTTPVIPESTPKITQALTLAPHTSPPTCQPNPGPSLMYYEPSENNLKAYNSCNQ